MTSTGEVKLNNGRNSGENGPECACRVNIDATEDYDSSRVLNLVPKGTRIEKCSSIIIDYSLTIHCQCGLLGHLLHF